MNEIIQKTIERLERFYKGFNVYRIEDKSIILFVYMTNGIDNVRLGLMRTLEGYREVEIEFLERKDD